MMRDASGLHSIGLGSLHNNRHKAVLSTVYSRHRITAPHAAALDELSEPRPLYAAGSALCR